MESKAYHHGNLRNSLIEKGIELINEVGEKQFSLRKVAEACGVSPAAPYSHFKNKEELIQEMQKYVTQRFMEQLNKAAMDCVDPDSTDVIVAIGRSYVKFFVQHPQYFPFLFHQPFMKINLSLTSGGEESFPPFEIFRSQAVRILGNTGVKSTDIEDKIINAWAHVHGLAAIITMKNVCYDKDWESRLEDWIY